jgi:pyruvate kinase
MKKPAKKNTPKTASSRTVTPPAPILIPSRKTKIVATIGPGTESKEAFTALLRAGINVARTNMSHDDQTIHSARIRTIRAVSKQERLPVAVLLDLSGPKIRIGDFAEGAVELIPGSAFVLTGKKCTGDASRVYFNYPYIRKDIKPGQLLMLDDGKKKLQVTKIVGDDIHTTVLVGGKTKSRRGVNIPGAYLSISAITEKDKSDLVFGIKEGVDFIALSFVRTEDDITQLRKLIAKHKGNQAIIAKIETEEAVQHIDAIIAAADGIMVARGDLAIEIGPPRVPSIQKMIMKKCNEAGKPVIVATQMLESMINTPVPTRAEVSDVANAIFDGCDAVMLSEETTLGQYPVEAVITMHNIAMQIEGEIGTHRRHRVHMDDLIDSVSSSVVHNAEDIHAKAIVALTESGFTPRMIARYKPQQRIIALTAHEAVARKLLLVFGCYPILIKPYTSLRQVSESASIMLTNLGITKKGDHFVVAAGIPFNVPGTTNMMMVVKVQ